LGDLTHDPFEETMQQLIRAATAAGMVALAASGCATSGAGGGATSQGAAPASQWQSLFDGRTMNQWRGYRDEDISAWHVVDGTITKSGTTGDLITRRPYGNFELELDWKIDQGGNSGIFYRATEEYDHVYWSGPEFQLLDDANAPDGKSRLTAAGSDYAVYPSPAGIVKPAGEWNTTRIVVNGNHVEHWLNGKKLLAYELNSPDWTERVKNSKFAAWPDYGKATMGYIGIQGDHTGTLSLRNLRIRELP
jgi:3-keto-disaccharide hydrolase